MPLRGFRRPYEQLSQFERGIIFGMMEDGWSARRVARQLGSSDCALRRCWGSERCHLHEDQAQDALDRLVIEKIDTSLRGERLNPAFALQRHTATTADVMVWEVIA
ncbi:transposable element Tcb1 transposase [Trichonephila clavipes]|nr:transposable element Tcb1 transposase [Trichonephila clavipes]